MNQKPIIPGVCFGKERSRRERWLHGHLHSGTMTAVIPLRRERAIVWNWGGKPGEGTVKVALGLLLSLENTESLSLVLPHCSYASSLTYP